MKYGLDFGTTNSAIAIDDNGVGKVLEIDQEALDKRVVRSMLYFPKREIKYKDRIPQARIDNQVFLVGDFWYEGEINPQIGQKAVKTYLEENKNRTAGVVRKVFTGRIIDMVTLQEAAASSDSIKEFYEEIDYGTGRLIQALKTGLKSPFYKGTTVFGQFFTLEELIGIYITEIKKIADEITGEVGDEVVVGRPVHFLNNPEKDKAAQARLEKALKEAGFSKITFQYEPVAAARQYIAESKNNEKNVFVFDFGGGTLDTAIVNAKSGEVLAADGVYIGGDLLNADIMQAKLLNYFGKGSVFGENQLPVPPHIFESLNSWYSIPNLNNPKTMNLFSELKYKNSDVEAINRLIYLVKMNLGFDLYEAIEKAKIKLSTMDKSEIVFKDGPIDIDVSITRTEFESIIHKRVEEIERVIWQTLATANIKPVEIDVVVRTGGSSLIPVFENLLIKIFGKEKIKQFETFTSIAAGLPL